MKKADRNRDISISRTPRILFFSGKGGVGKTTLAGTASIHLAQKGEKVLVASTDPAHSLSDLFGMPLSGEATKVASGVDAVEVDASGTVAQMFQGLGPVSENGRFAGIADLLKTASQSPGVDELVSLDVLLRLIEQPEYDSVILDTAPTGHTLRLLALPELMDRYLGGLMKLRGQITRLGKSVKKLFRVSSVFPSEGLEEELIGARGRMQALGEMIRSPEQCGLVLVTIPEAMSVLETKRTIDFLTDQDIPIAAVMINMLQPKQSDCDFCVRRRQAQRIQIEKMKRHDPDIPIITIEHTRDEPRGCRLLGELAPKIWRDYERVLEGP
jgi:arsenite-transporting ATPase